MKEFRYILCTGIGQYDDDRFIYRTNEGGEIYIYTKKGRWVITDNSPYIIANAKNVVELVESEVKMMSINI